MYVTRLQENRCPIETTHGIKTPKLCERESESNATALLKTMHAIDGLLAVYSSVAFEIN